MAKKIVAIWAQDQAGLIGKENRLPWHLPAELKHFKEITMGQIILMGRVTFDGMDRKVLPGRQTVILTRDSAFDFEHEQVLVFHDKKSVLDWYQDRDETLYIIGGAQIFSAFEEDLDEIILTQVEARLEGDTYFPSDFDLDAFKLEKEVFHAKDEKNSYDFTVQFYMRKEK